MSENHTVSERRWPDTPEFNSVLRTWKTAGSVILLRFVWSGYDLFYKDVLSQINLSQNDEDLERNITQLLEPKIQESMSGLEPFYVQHGPYEEETRQPSPAMPPQYDLAFILRSNPRIMWPLEAKILRTDGNVGNYVTEINDDFLTCRYSPFSNEAAMLGYMITGDFDKAFDNISSKGKWALSNHSDFNNRPHKVSSHIRQVPNDKRYPIEFQCHHLLFKLWN